MERGLYVNTPAHVGCICVGVNSGLTRVYTMHVSKPVLTHTENPVVAPDVLPTQEVGLPLPMREKMAGSWRNSSRVPGHCPAGTTEVLCFHLITKHSLISMYVHTIYMHTDTSTHMCTYTAQHMVPIHTPTRHKNVCTHVCTHACT